MNSVSGGSQAQRRLFMTGMKRKPVLGGGLLGLLGAAVAQGMMGDKMTGGVTTDTYVRGVHVHASKYIVSLIARADRPNPTFNNTSKQYVTTAKIHNTRTFNKPFIGKRSKPNTSLI